MPEETTVAFVSRSAVRRAVLLAVEAEPRSAGELVASLPMSRSGVYKALDELSDRDLLDRSDGDVWHPTGPGLLVADELDRHRWVEDLLSHSDYWLEHDLSVLPERFRRRLPALRNAEVLRNPDDRPRYLERRWTETMPDTDRLWVGSRIFHGPYADAMDEQAETGFETRLISDVSLIERNRDGFRATLDRRPDAVRQRVHDIPCSFMLTDDVFTLSLPLHDGSYDDETVLVGEDDPALQFGEEFVAHYWERATPLETYLAVEE